jgi:hypothetical protein
VNLSRIALIAMAALSVWACFSHFSGRRHSPKSRDLERLTVFLVQVLQRNDKSPGQLQHEIAEKFSDPQIYHLVMTCRDWSDASTEDPKGSLEDVDILKFCFCESLKVLKARGARIQLRRIFLDARVDDGWRMLWHESLGTDWLAKNPFVMPEKNPDLIPEP